MKTKDTLGDRAKLYEQASGCYDVLPPRMPILLRLDGISFSSYTKGCKKPFDQSLIDAMNQAGIALCSKIQGAQIAYLQSDEITVLIHGYKKLTSEAWFGGRRSKIETASASIASTVVSFESPKIFGKYKQALFDSRAFVVPENDVCNVILWRQQDATRNSISSVAQSLFSHKELHKKNSKELQEMIYQKSGKNWNDLQTFLKRGRCIVKETNDLGRSVWKVDNEIPILSQDRNYIEKYLKTEE